MQSAQVQNENGNKSGSDPGEEQLSVFLAATIISGTNRISVTVCSVSRNGALIHSSIVPPLGSIVRLQRGDVSVSARFGWTGHGSFALEFRETIDQRSLFVAVDPSRMNENEPRLRALLPRPPHRDLPTSKH